LFCFSGLGHVEGIKQWWEKPIDHVALMKLPPPAPKYQKLLLYGALASIPLAGMVLLYVMYKMFPISIPLFWFLALSIYFIYLETLGRQDVSLTLDALLKQRGEQET
jgi:hypothetical protein